MFSGASPTPSAFGVRLLHRRRLRSSVASACIIDANLWRLYNASATKGSASLAQTTPLPMSTNAKKGRLQQRKKPDYSYDTITEHLKFPKNGAIGGTNNFTSTLMSETNAFYCPSEIPCLTTRLFGAKPLIHHL